jgi:hypothetical protein
MSPVATPSLHPGTDAKLDDDATLSSVVDCSLGRFVRGDLTF